MTTALIFRFGGKAMERGKEAGRAGRKGEGAV